MLVFVPVLTCAGFMSKVSPRPDCHKSGGYANQTHSLAPLSRFLSQSTFSLSLSLALSLSHSFSPPLSLSLHLLPFQSFLLAILTLSLMLFEVPFLKSRLFLSIYPGFFIFLSLSCIDIWKTKIPVIALPCEGNWKEERKREKTYHHNSFLSMRLSPVGVVSQRC